MKCIISWHPPEPNCILSLWIWICVFISVPVLPRPLYACVWLCFASEYLFVIPKRKSTWEIVWKISLSLSFLFDAIVVVAAVLGDAAVVVVIVNFIVGTVWGLFISFFPPILPILLLRSERKLEVPSRSTFQKRLFGTGRTSFCCMLDV